MPQKIFSTTPWPLVWRRGAAAGSLLLALLVIGPAGDSLFSRPAYGQLPIEDVIVSDPRTRIFDPEFTSDPGAPFGRFVWSTQDDKREVWIGQIDRATGDFVPRNGKFTLVDNRLGALKVPNEVGNGPEWVFTQGTGPQIIYSVQSSDPEQRGRLARAYRNADGTWTSEVLPNPDNRIAPIGSLNRGDGNPTISYLFVNTQNIIVCPGEPVPRSEFITTWRNLNDPNSEREVPGIRPNGLRWVPTLRALAFHADADGDPCNKEPDGSGAESRQAFIYYVDKSPTDPTAVEQLTFDEGKKVSIFFWQAPEFNDELLFMAVINDERVGVYRKLNGVWTRINTLKPPSKGNFIESPEPFTHNGRSYIYMVTKDNPATVNKQAPSDIWVGGIDPAAPYYRQCSDQTQKVRKDPEVFVTDRGPYIYYSAKPAEGSSAVIYRCDTGLGPPQ